MDPGTFCTPSNTCFTPRTRRTKKITTWNLEQMRPIACLLPNYSMYIPERMFTDRGKNDTVVSSSLLHTDTTSAVFHSTPSRRSCVDDNGHALQRRSIIVASGTCLRGKKKQVKVMPPSRMDAINDEHVRTQLTLQSALPLASNSEHRSAPVACAQHNFGINHERSQSPILNLDKQIQKSGGTLWFVGCTARNICLTLGERYMYTIERAPKT